MLKYAQARKGLQRCDRCERTLLHKNGLAVQPLPIIVPRFRRGGSTFLFVPLQKKGGIALTTMEVLTLCLVIIGVINIVINVTKTK